MSKRIETQVMEANTSKPKKRFPNSPRMVSPMVSPMASPLALVKPQKSTAIIAGWVILIIGYALALIPGIGLAMLILGIPVCLASGLLGILGASNGKPFRGVVLTLCSIASYLIFLILPWLSSLIGMMIAGSNHQ